MLIDSNFTITHKLSVTAFTRARKLGFDCVIMLILKKSLKSLQNRLNEFFDKFCSDLVPATASAFTQARSNLSHSAFIALNKEGVVDPFYADGVYKKWRNYRLLAIDGSRLTLPPSNEIRDELGFLTTTDNKGVVQGEYNAALVSVLYDVLNGIAVDSTLSNCRSSEKRLAINHLEHVNKGDILLFDRGYPSYEFLAYISQRSADFVGRCSRGSFNQAQKMFDDDTITSLVTTITPPPYLSKKKLKELGLPLKLTVRFVRVILSTGEPEILVTSLLDESLSADDFKELYYLRWGIETYYHILKSHLALENFSGLTLESVMQDFYAMVFMTSLEAILVDDAQISLGNKKTEHQQTVNRAISFNTLKNNVMQLLQCDDDIESILTKMSALFLINPTIRRKGRHVDRKTATQGQMINFLRRKKKIVF
jgi:hypothetical protein